MLNYELALESANAELRAYETISNLNIFFEGISSEIVLEGTFKDGLIKFKNTIVSFFKMIAEAIVRFFVNLFGQGQRLMHREVIKLIVDYFKKWLSSLNSTKITVEKYISNLRAKKNGGSDDGSSFDTSVSDVVEKIQEETENLKDTVEKILFKSHEKKDYVFVNKADFEVLTTFSTECKDLVVKIFAPFETEAENFSPQQKNKFTNYMNNIMKMASLVEKTAMEMVAKATWKERESNNTENLKTPFPEDGVSFDFD